MAKVEGKNLLHVKRQNIASIREAIYRFGPISRSEIAELLCLTPPTITANVASMMEMGILRECVHNEAEIDKKALGRRPIKIEFIPDAYYAIGIDIGPYRTSMCIVDLQGKIVSSLITSPAPERYDEMVGKIISEIKTLIRKSGIDRTKLLGAGIGLPGFIDGHNGIIRSSFHKGWNNLNLAKDIERLSGLSVKIENNSRARAIGLDLFNALITNTESFAYYFISNGIACSLMIKNSMLIGETAGAGEAGHMVMDLNGPICDICGKKGCLDAISSERAIRHQVADSMKSGKSTLLFGICKDTRHPSMKEILEAQDKGDPLVCAVMDNAITYLGIGLANIINLISPHLVVVDGLIMSLEQNRERLAAIAKRNMFGLNTAEVDIRFIPYEEQGGARGAASLAIKYFFLRQ